MRLSKLLIAGLMLSPALANAQEKMPTAKEVMARYVKASGGKAAYEKVKNYKFNGTINIAAIGIKGTVDIMGRIKPVAQKQTLDLGPAAGGTITRCFAGKQAWELNPVMGPRVLSGQELAQAAREASFVLELNPEKHYKAMKVVGKEKVGDEECYKLELTPKMGKPETAFYSVKSGLAVKRVQTVASPQGDVRVESVQSDYRKVDGVTMAFKTEQRLSNGMTFLVEMKKVEFNKELPEDAFAAPDQVKGMLKSDKADAAKE